MDRHVPPFYFPTRLRFRRSTRELAEYLYEWHGGDVSRSLRLRIRIALERTFLQRRSEGVSGRDIGHLSRLRNRWHKRNEAKPERSSQSERPKTETSKKVNSPKATHVCKVTALSEPIQTAVRPSRQVFSKRDGRCHPVEKKEQPPVNPGELLSKTCPDGSKVPVFKKCPSGNGGTNTQSQPPQHNCPPGYRVLDKPNRYGAYCEAPASTGKCPPSAPEGSPPNCHCPAGTVSREGFCRPATCGPNMTGVPPNCHRVCPAGTVNRTSHVCPSASPARSVRRRSLFQHRRSAWATRF